MNLSGVLVLVAKRVVRCFVLLELRGGELVAKEIQVLDMVAKRSSGDLG